MRLAKNGCSRVVWLPALALALIARASFGQDTPASPPAPSAPDAAPSAEPNPPRPAPAPPDASAPGEPALASVPPSEPPAPTAPDAAPKTGAASFAPLPTPSAEPARPSKPTAQSSREAPEAEDAEDGQPSPTPTRGEAPSVSNGPVASSDSTSERDSDDANGAFGPFRIGLLLGSGLPDLLSLGGAIKLTRYFGAGINVGLIPAVKLSFYGDAKLSFQEYDVYGHIFPFGGAFFLGAGVGYATVHGTLVNSFSLAAYRMQNTAIPASAEIESQASVRTLVLTPQLGLLHTFKSGFTLGADFGAQVPIAPSQVDFTTQIPAVLKSFPQYPDIKKQYFDPNDAKVRSTLDKIGRTPIPTIGVNIGWLL